MEKKNNSNLQELSIGDKIIGRDCSECEQPITQDDYENKNFTL
ncbi:MAG: hypothetical protein NY202_03540 [Mollicutes bacterium UO1]